MVGRWCVAFLLLVVLCSFTLAATDDERLATLAAKMLDLKADLGTTDFVMDCGPADEVLNTKPTNLRSSHYCILNATGKMVIGTFDDPTTQNVQRLMLLAYNDSQYSAHIDTARFMERACDGRGVTGFEECPNGVRVRGTLPVLRVYIYDDELSSGATYLLISDAPLNSVRSTKTIYGEIEAFFRRLFS